MEKRTRKEIPIVFAVDNNFAPFLVVSLESILDKCDNSYMYRIFVLQTNISKENEELIKEYKRENVSIEFVDVTKQLDSIGTALHLRDYYTNTIYYRLFIPALFPQYKKVLYMDCDIILKEDISKLFNINVNNYLMGVIEEDVMVYYDVFGKYAEEVVGVDRKRYFNSGILLMNTDKCRKYSIENKFVSLLKRFQFIVAPDQDYLNVLCKDKVLYLDRGWNKSPLEQADFKENSLKLIHYKMGNKPWHLEGVKYEEYFWETAKKTKLYGMLLEMRNNYGKEGLKKDAEALERLKIKAQKDSADPNNYYNTIKREYLEKNNYLTKTSEFMDFLDLNIVFENNDLRIVSNI